MLATEVFIFIFPQNYPANGYFPAVRRSHGRELVDAMGLMSSTQVMRFGMKPVNSKGGWLESAPWIKALRGVSAAAAKNRSIRVSRDALKLPAARPYPCTMELDRSPKFGGS